jgi:hypothetical protein
MFDDSGEIPKDMEIIDSIFTKTLKSGFLVEVKLVKRPKQYEAALFINDKYKPGPPVPRPMETPAGEATHWMGVRPKVGFTTEEADTILDEVSGQNVLHRIHFVDKWGVQDEE